MQAQEAIPQTARLKFGAPVPAVQDVEPDFQTVDTHPNKWAEAEDRAEDLRDDGDGTDAEVIVEAEEPDSLVPEPNPEEGGEPDPAPEPEDDYVGVQDGAPEQEELPAEVADETSDVTTETPVEVDEENQEDEPTAEGKAVQDESEALPQQMLQEVPVEDADELTVEELQEQKELLDAKIEEKRKAEKFSVMSQIKTVVETYKISAEELVDFLGGIKVKRKGVKAKVKYRDPVSGVTWSGRGKPPLWIKDQDYDKFLIVDDADNS